jgi:hypothetical protein
VYFFGLKIGAASMPKLTWAEQIENASKERRHDMGVGPFFVLCLSETQSVWPFGSNRLMLTADA